MFMRLIVNDETNSCYFEMECKLFSFFLDTGVKKLGGKGEQDGDDTATRIIVVLFFFFFISLAHERLRYALGKTQQILQHNQYR